VIVLQALVADSKAFGVHARSLNKIREQRAWFGHFSRIGVVSVNLKGGFEFVSHFLKFFFAAKANFMPAENHLLNQNHFT